MNNRDFGRRRRQLMRMIGKGGIAILPSAPTRTRNRDVEHAYRQDSDFHYLTGFPEPEAVAVLAPGRAHGEFVMFCRDRDPERETWDGRRAGPEGVVKDFGADDAFPISDIDDILPGLLENCERVYYAMGLNAEFDQRLLGWINQLRAASKNGVTAPNEFVALDHLLHDMRLFKSRSEIATMRKAAKIAAGAHVRAMRHCRPGLTEYEIEAEFLHEFRRHDATVSYQPIVGGGENACILHYVENRDRLKEGDLLLIDAGCELECYASDITRTFPVSGRFTDEQRALYEVVLEAQLAAIDKVRPGNHWNEPHEAAVRVLTRGLIRLGLLKGRVPTLVKNGDYRRFYMHRTGHWLGLDVHDVGDYKVGEEWRILEPGMVLTVEPGLYIAPGTRGVAKKWWGMGVRIEDDVLVTRDAPDVLSRDAPKDPAEIERLMNAA
ncbi:Xaa-Pro aminopeptidase [Wenzhouxiangella sp. XN24]|uniref:Xaa-Pro aminopeptidase n=1 Tax=Wenzhouxiangella sp. XN24 TaxID=2713569 RepID=UPI0013ED4B7D|nr:Xaa-Pro aminopeptidase [Wenzhouxiangella sp. XN24]NGX15884.1 Xaa-Pro aminopeptidase [Wenzhouxiangella sp. XN24]